MEGLRVAAIFIIMILLLQRKVNTGIVMVLGSLFFGVFYLMHPIDILKTAADSLFIRSTIELMLVLILISALEYVLRVSELMPKMIRALRGLVSDSRVIMAFLPALLGLLPSPGGARFSAPMVGEIAEQIKSLNQEEKSLINYWFRHIWEYIFPLYPGLILAAAFIERGVGEIFKYNLPFTLLSLTVGSLFCFRNLKEKEIKTTYTGSKESLWKNFLSGIFPIALIIFLVVFVKFNIVYSLLSVIILVIIWKGIKDKEIIDLVKTSFSLNMIILVFGVIFFRNMMERSGGFAEVIQLIENLGIAPWIVVALLPLITGILTGMVLPMVSISFPIIIGFIGTGMDVNWPLFSLAFGFGFSGVMLSPLHLCLLLTIDHFKADFNKTFRLLLIPQSILMICIYIVYRVYLVIY